LRLDPPTTNILGSDKEAATTATVFGNAGNQGWWTNQGQTGHWVLARMRI
jgi:hypothetical protein